MRRFKVIRTSTKEVIDRILANDYSEAVKKSQAKGHSRCYLEAETNATSLGDAF